MSGLTAGEKQIPVVGRELAPPAGATARRTRVVPLFLLGPLALFLLVFLVWPVVRMGIMSFYKADPSELWVEVFTLNNYAKLFGDPFLINVLIRTLRFAVVTTILCIVLAYPVAYFLARTKSRLRGLYTLMVFMPLLVSVIVRSYGWMALLGDQGVINSIWKALPFSEGALPLMFGEHSVILGLVQVLLPLMVIPLMSAIGNIDPSLEESAISLGAGPARVFFQVILPLSTPGLISGILLVFTSGMSAFAIPMFLGGPRQMTMAVLIYQQMTFTFDWPLGSAVAMLMLLATVTSVVLSLTIANRMVPHGLRMSGSKQE